MIIPDLSKYSAVIFDNDGTLVETFKTTPLPGRAERIAELRKQGKQMAVCTNQAGPLWRWYTEKDKFPTVATIGGNIREICAGLQLSQEHWFVAISDERVLDAMLKQEINTDAFMAVQLEYNDALARIQLEFEEHLEKSLVHVSGDSSWRKPKGGMLLAAAGQFDVPIEQCLFVGDRTEDEQAARNAQMDFMWSAAFFGDDQGLGELADHPF